MIKRAGVLALILACTVYANDVNRIEVEEKQFFENSGIVRLEETTISGDGFENTIRDTPKNITIVTAKDIKESGARSIVDAVKLVPGVKISVGTGNTGAIDIRGQGAKFNSNTAVIVDGVKMNSIAMSKFNFYSIPIETVEKIEIIPSGASVVYGDNTVGGAINIITKNAKGKDNFTLQMEAGSYNELKSNFGFNTTAGKFKVFGNATKKNTDGYRENSELKADDVTVGTKYQLNDVNALTLKYDYHKDNMRFPGKLTKKELEDDRTQTTSPNKWGENKSDRVILGYNYKKDNFEILNNTSYYENIYKSFLHANSKTETDTLNFSNDFKMKYNTDRNKLIIGFDILDGKVDEKSKSQWAKKQSLGGFISNTYSITDKIDLNAGVRHQYIKFEYSKDVEDKKYNIPVYDLAVNYKYSDTGSTFISYGTDFRSPATNELLASNGYLNTDLKPQKGENFEIGVKDYFADTFISTSIFHKIVKDEIFYDKSNLSGGRGTNSNYDEANKKIGFELLMERNFTKKLILTTSYSYIQSEIDGGEDKGNKTPGVSENKLSLGGKYNFTKKLKSNLMINYIGSSYAFSDVKNQYKKVDSYVTLDLNLSYDINSSFNIYGGIKNLTNESYNEYVGAGSNGKFYYPAPENQYYIGFRYTM